MLPTNLGSFWRVILSLLAAIVLVVTFAPPAIAQTVAVGLGVVGVIVVIVYLVLRRRYG